MLLLVFTGRHAPPPHVASDGGREPEELTCCPGVICSPELTVGTSPIGNVFPLLLLPYVFLSFSGCIMTLCLYLCLEAIHVASRILGILQRKTSLGVPDATRQLSVAVPAHDSIAVASSVVHNLGL